MKESEFIFCDVQDIVRHLRPRDSSAAVRFVEAFRSSAELLANMPHLGRKRPDLDAPETRSWRVRTFRNYLLFYEVFPDRVRLLRVLHGFRDLQAELAKC